VTGGLEGRVLAPTVVEYVVAPLGEVAEHYLAPHRGLIASQEQDFPVQGLKS
jgi:hypothetical protein